MVFNQQISYVLNSNNSHFLYGQVQNLSCESFICMRIKNDLHIRAWLCIMPTFKQRPTYDNSKMA